MKSSMHLLSIKAAKFYPGDKLAYFFLQKEGNEPNFGLMNCFSPLKL